MSTREPIDLGAATQPFGPDEFRRRIHRLREQMSQAAVGCTLVHSPSAIYYFSGYQTVSSNQYACLLIPLDNEPILILWHLEVAGASRTSWMSRFVTYETGEDPTAPTCREAQAWISDRGLLAVELQAAALPPRMYKTIEAAFTPGRIVDAGPLFDAVRRVKSDEELECYRRAAPLTDAAMKATVAAATSGRTDNEAAAAGLQAMIAGGSDYPCLPAIVSAGEQSAVAHSTFANVRLKSGDGIVVELGACVRRYSAPLMRTVCVGPASAVVREMHAAAAEVLDCVLAELRPGVAAEDIAKAAWRRMPTYPDLVFHGVFGYAVGAGFPPGWADGTVRIRLTNPQPIEVGMVLHIPIAFRRPPIAGVAVSETVIVTGRGVEILGNTPRRLLMGGEAL